MGSMINVTRIEEEKGTMPTEVVVSNVLELWVRKTRGERTWEELTFATYRTSITNENKVDVLILTGPETGNIYKDLTVCYRKITKPSLTFAINAGEHQNQFTIVAEDRKKSKTNAEFLKYAKLNHLNTKEEKISVEKLQTLAEKLNLASSYDGRHNHLFELPKLSKQVEETGFDL